MASFTSGVVVSVLVLLVAGAQAFFFGRGDPTAVSDGRAIEQECLALAEAGSCEFYTCFERRLPCGRDWYMLRHGLYYCNKAQRLRNNFTPAGQQFLSDAQRCMTRALKATYQLEYINCHTLEHTAVDSITTCSIDHAFCNVYDDNASNFLSIYEPSDLFSRGALKIWRAMTTLTATCLRQRVQELGSNAASTIMDAFNSVQIGNDDQAP